MASRHPQHPTATAPLPMYLAGVVAALVVVRLMYLGEPTGRDEAGFLMVGTGWDDGASLYGSYWVDRPPLLIWIMQLAGSVGVLRLWGLGASILVVLGVARTAYVCASWSAVQVRTTGRSTARVSAARAAAGRAAGERAARWAAAAAAVFSAASWFGVARTNGEMLAGAFVAWGFACAAHALLRPAPSASATWIWGVSAGALGACAMLVKQTIVDGLVFAIVLALVVGSRRRLRARAITVLVATLVGLLLALGVGLAAASARGTSPGELFEALVTFRADAGEVIRTSASDATARRLVVVLATWVASGLALVTALALGQAARRRDPAVVAASAVLVVVSAAALLGGSYWNHYLLQLVPAAALAVGLLADAVTPRLRTRLAAAVLVATAGNLVFALVTPASEGAEAQVVGRWLQASGAASDTAVVAYGQPNVLAAARMSSPYPYLWSLPVRTLDPDLRELSAVMTGPERPVWFVDWSGVDSWGIDPTALRTVLSAGYREVADVCGRTVWLVSGRPRPLAPVPRSCP